MIKCCLFILTITWGWNLNSQNIDLYLTLLEKGRIEEVKENLSELIDTQMKQVFICYRQW